MRSIRANAERRDRCRGVTGADENRNAEHDARCAHEATAPPHRTIVPRLSPRRASGAIRRCRRFTDQRGRRFSFEKLPERVVFLPMPGPSTSRDRWNGAHIVGINAHRRRRCAKESCLRRFPKVLGSRPTSNGAGSHSERRNRSCAAARCRFSVGDISDRRSRTHRPSRARYARRLQDDLAGFITTLGRVAGNETHAAAVLARLEAEKRRIETAMSSIADVSVRACFISTAPRRFFAVSARNPITISISG